MKTYSVRLQSPISKSYRCIKAAQSLDIDPKKKSVHALRIEADLDTAYNIGLIVGASGSGKTTLAKQIWGDCFRSLLDPEKPIIDQFGPAWSYDECVHMLSGIGLTQVVCWIRPAVTLSNGQQARAECALQMAAAQSDAPVVIDEWTSVVDRTVAKVMSHSIQKHARRTGKTVVLLSCHYDIVEWLNPDWVIDCNRQEYVDRRLLCHSSERSEKLTFDIREVERKTWKFFSRYHYLSEHLAAGRSVFFGLFHGDNQVGFQAFTNYVPHRDKTQPMQMHSNRTVIHPDYAGFGIGIRLIGETSEIMARRGYDVRAKFSSAPIYRAMSRDKRWQLVNVERRTTASDCRELERKTGYRVDLRTYSFKFNPEESTADKAAAFGLAPARVFD